jgi:hypothetical protein
MIGKLKVFNIGADWFFQEMKAQDIAIRPVEWAPPFQVPEDIGGILKALKG